MIGFVAGQGDVSQLPAQLLGKAAFLRGILIGSVHQYVLPFPPWCVREHVADMLSRFRDMNRLITINNIKPVVDCVFDFDQAPEAYEYLESQKHVGKVVIKVAQ
jgi:NADPH:quinone reductase-like Zn-dependent oxidoreductase